MDFVGRADELTLVRGALVDASKRRSSVLWVEAAAGAGKTAFVQHVVEAAPPATLVRRVGAEEIAGGVAFALVDQFGVAHDEHPFVDGIDEGFMIHDFAITRRYVVLVVGPLAFDLEAMFHGGSPLDWRPQLGTRIAVIPRDRQGATTWVHTDAFWAWHYANAFDDGDLVQLDFPCSSAPKMALPDSALPPTTGGFTRATINPVAGTVELHLLDDHLLEFPRIDDRRTGLRHRHLVVAGRSADPRVLPGEHDQLHQYDMDAGTSVRYDAHAAIGEAVFAPRAGSTDELDGYYLTYATELDADRTSLLVFDAADVPAGPIAQVRIPPPSPQRPPRQLVPRKLNLSDAGQDRWSASSRRSGDAARRLGADGPRRAANNRSCELASTQPVSR